MCYNPSLETCYTWLSMKPTLVTATVFRKRCFRIQNHTSPLEICFDPRAGQIMSPIRAPVEDSLDEADHDMVHSEVSVRASQSNFSREKKRGQARLLLRNCRSHRKRACPVPVPFDFPLLTPTARPSARTAGEKSFHPIAG